MRIQTLTATALLSALMAIGPGCGGPTDDIERQAVSGAVTLDGKPLVHGDITLSPLDAGPSAGGAIVDGTYAIDRPRGPSAGAYRVMIVSIKPTGRKIPDPDGPPGNTVDEMTNIVPDRYNVKSELKIEVKKEGRNTFNFDLSSAPRGRP